METSKRCVNELGDDFNNHSLWLRISALYLAVLYLVAYVSSVAPVLDAQLLENKVVGVYFYVWYSSEGRHWNCSDVTVVVDAPVLGLYDSRDPGVINWQLGLIREAGFDFLIISWWGPGSFEDEAAVHVVERLGDHGLKFAVIVEPYLGNDPSIYNREFWDNTLEYLESRFIKPYRDRYMYLHGKPLVLAFNPIGLSYRPHGDFPEYTIRITGNDIDNARYQDWDYWPDYLAGSTQVELRVRVDRMVSVTPRFCDIHFRKPGVCIDPDLTQGFYEKQWKWIIENRDKVDIVIVTSWNEYHERTHIEPSTTRGNNDPWRLYRVTKQYIKQFKSSDSNTPWLNLATTTAMTILVFITVYSITRKRLKPGSHGRDVYSPMREYDSIFLVSTLNTIMVLPYTRPPISMSLFT